MDNIKRPNPVEIVIDGKPYKIEMRVVNVGKLRDAFGTVGSAEAELFRVMGEKDENGQTEFQKFSADFVSVMTKYLDCILVDAPPLAFLRAEMEELTGIAEGIAEMIRRYMPDAKKAQASKEKKTIDPM